MTTPKEIRMGWYHLLWLPLLMMLFTGCLSRKAIQPKNDTLSGELPLLMGSQKIGMITGFNASNPASTNDSIEARWREAIEEGLSVGRLQIDWPELEPEPGLYDKKVLEEKLMEFREENLQAFLLISAYDSDGPVLPEDLEGKDLDDKELMERFKRLMDWVIPMLGDYNAFLISISNEADNSFNDIPGLHRDVLKFLQEIREHIHKIDENMAVTVTLAEGSLDEDKPGIPEIIAECDVACWNFYGAKSTGTPPFTAVLSEEEIRSDVKRMLEVSGEKNIVIQELGMHSGDVLLGSSGEIQRSFFETFFQEMKKEDRIRGAFVFQLVDWSPETTDFLIELLINENVPEAFVESYGESLKTIGLIKYEDGRRKLAWNEFVKWIGEFR